MPTDKSLRVSVIVPAHNRPAFLPSAIRSALEQTLTPSEVIVVDDCSDSDIRTALQGFDERVRYLRLRENRGANAARNAGVAAARGDVVAFLDDDDRWLPDKLATQVPLLARGYEASICGWQFELGGKPQVQAVTEITDDMLRRGNPYCGTSGLVAWRHVVGEVPFDETLQKGQDWDIFVRLAQRQPLAYVPRSLFWRPSSEHESITQGARDVSPAELLRRAKTVMKHRDWLGERHYRHLLATNLLTGFRRRKNKHRYVFAALKEAGPAATFRAVVALRRRRHKHELK